MTTSMLEPPNLAASQVLCFRLATQDYALDVLKVREIRRFDKPTPLPDVPHYVLGVLNLRGTVIPVFDLRRRFGLADPSERLTAVIIVAIATRNVGLVVDEVTRVMDVVPGMLRPTPPLPGLGDRAFLRALIATGDRIITWLDAGDLLSVDLEAT